MKTTYSMRVKSEDQSSSIPWQTVKSRILSQEQPRSQELLNNQINNHHRTTKL